MSTESSIDSLSVSPYNYDHVPTLKELLPTTSGIPGVEYVQVCQANAKPAQDDGWGGVEGTKLYTINGPKGSSDMILACKGEPIQGASTQEGARKMFLDPDIYRLTGKWLGYLPIELQEEFKVGELHKPLEVFPEDSVPKPKLESEIVVTPDPKSSPTSLEAALAQAT